MTLASLVLLFAAYMLVDGIFAIIAGVRATRRHERWGLLVLEGIADIVAGGIAIVWPVITILVFVYLMGAWAIVSGILLLSAAFRLNIAHGRWLMGLGGVASVIWGFLLLLWPLAGAVVLTWWIGAYMHSSSAARCSHSLSGCAGCGMSYRRPERRLRRYKSRADPAVRQKSRYGLAPSACRPIFAARSPSFSPRFSTLDQCRRERDVAPAFRPRTISGPDYA